MIDMKSFRYFQRYKILVQFYRTHKHHIGGNMMFMSFILIQETYDNGYQTCLTFDDDIIEDSSITHQNLEQSFLSFLS